MNRLNYFICNLKTDPKCKILTTNICLYPWNLLEYCKQIKQFTLNAYSLFVTILFSLL